MLGAAGAAVLLGVSVLMAGGVGVLLFVIGAAIGVASVAGVCAGADGYAGGVCEESLAWA